MRRLSHQTHGAMKNAVVGEDYAAFQTGARVQTTDGFPGRVVAVLTGPYPQTETYEVRLDNNLGGGEYTARQLRPLTERTAAVEEPMAVEASEIHLASEDYPELGSILYDRPPNERVQVYAGLRTTAAFDWDELDCTSCAGTGEQGKYYCPACGGTGKRADQDPSIVPQYPTEPPCTACSGTGEQGTGHECYVATHEGVAYEAYLDHGAYDEGQGRSERLLDLAAVRPAERVWQGDDRWGDSIRTSSGLGLNERTDPGWFAVGSSLSSQTVCKSGTSRTGDLSGEHTPRNRSWLGNALSAGPPVQQGEHNAVRRQETLSYLQGMDRTADVEQIPPPSACSWCGHDQFVNPTNTGRGLRMECAQCGATMTSWGGQWQPDMTSSPENHPSRDADFRAVINDPAAVHASLNRIPTDLRGATHASLATLCSCGHRSDKHYVPGQPDRDPNPHACQWCSCDKFRPVAPDRSASLTADSWDHWLAPETIATRRNFGEQMMARYDLLNTGDPTAAAIAVDPGSDPVGYLRGLAAQANYDPDLGFHMLATWAEVREKAKRIKDSGGVRILAANAHGVAGEVQGEHALYESAFNYVPGTRKLADWNCGCKWGAYAWGRSPAYRRFEGRKCSHVTALQFEAQSRGMFGQDVGEDRHRLPGQYQRSPVTVQYERPTERADGGNLNRRSVPPGNMRRTFSSSIHPDSEYAQQGHDETSAFETAINRVQQRHFAEGNRLWHEHGQDSDHHDNAYSLGVAPENALQNFHDANGGQEPSPEEHVEYMRGAYGDDGQHPLWDEVEDEVRRMKSAPQQHEGALDLAPVHVFAREMAQAGDTPDAVFRMLANHGVAQDNALRIVRWAVTGDDDGGSTQPGEDIPGITTRDTTEFKKKPHHHDHHTNDTRRHAPDFGRGIGWYAPGLMWCDQCSGSGCGHCGGTGQVMQGVSPTGGPGVGDLSTTTSPIADEDADAGEDVSGGISADAARQYRTLGDGSQTWTAKCEAPGCKKQISERNWDSDFSWVSERDNDDSHREFCSSGHALKAMNAHPDEWDQTGEDGGWGYHSNGQPRTTHDHYRERAGSGHQATLQQHQWLLQHYADASTTLMGGNPAPANNPLTPHSDSRNPGSTGWGTSADPHAWTHPIINNSYEISAEAGLHTGGAEGQPSLPDYTHAGVALKAADTGRVLMIQRSFKDESDPAKGTWEFPGGGKEEGDQTSLHTGIREWQEEVGQPFPEGGHVSHTWRAGTYHGHVVTIPTEDQVDFSNGRSTVNPDDPDGDDHEQAAWWDPQHAKKNPALRQELKKDNPFGAIEKAAAFLTMDQVLEVARAEERRTGKSSEQLLREHVAWQEQQLADWSRNGSVTAADPVGGNPEFGTYKAATSMPTTAELHDGPEAALPSTDGGIEDDPAPEDDDTGWQPGDPAPGQYLSAQPDIPWGYPGGPSEPPPLQLSSSLDDVPLDQLVVVFQSTAMGRQLASDAATAPPTELAVGGGRPQQGAPPPEIQAENAQLAAIARAVLAGEVEIGEDGISKSAMKNFDLAEQQELITEGADDGTRARNFEGLQIEGTHYALLDDPEMAGWM